MLALFECSAHPQYSPAFAASSISYLDNIIRRLQLTVIDHHDPDLSSFASRTFRKAPFGHQTKGSLSEVFMHSAASECQPAIRSLLVHLVIRSSMGFLLEFERAVQRGVLTTLLECFNPGGRPLVTIGGLDKEPSQFFLTDPGNVHLFITCMIDHISDELV